jgi:hypothetical protein
MEERGSNMVWATANIASKWLESSSCPDSAAMDMGSRWISQRGHELYGHVRVAELGYPQSTGSA